MSVRFDTTAYQATYGRTPRGRGSWAFAFDRARDHYFFVNGQMTFGQAKRAASQTAARTVGPGVCVLYVCT